MNVMQKISEAASMGLHAMVYLAGSTDRIVTTQEMAEKLNVSKDHLSKVLQRLTRARLVKSVRGPKGGFVLGKSADKITLLEIYEVIEGKLEKSDCILGEKACRGDDCIFGDLVTRIDGEVRVYLKGTCLQDLKDTFK